MIETIRTSSTVSANANNVSINPIVTINGSNYVNENIDPSPQSLRDESIISTYDYQNYQEDSPTNYDDRRDIRSESYNGDLISKKSSHFGIEVIKIVNVVFSLVIGVYFILAEYYDNVQEYSQILFLAVLINVLDTNEEQKSLRHFWSCMVSAPTAMFLYALVHSKSWNLTNVIGRCMMILCGTLYLLGPILCCYTILERPLNKSIEQKNNFIDVDLLVYLFALNAICLLPESSFNASLHMILDIRMIVLLYGGLYRLREKSDLLRIKSFILILISVMVFFILIALAQKKWYIILLAFIVNCTIGITLILQARYFYFFKYPQMRKLLQINQDYIDSRTKDEYKGVKDEERGK